MRHSEKQRNSTQPKGELASRTLAMPADSNPKGDIFGGWIMSLMDSAGKMSATPPRRGTGRHRCRLEHHFPAAGACR